MMQKSDNGCIMQWMGIIIDQHDGAVVSIFFLCYSDLVLYSAPDSW